MSASFCTPLELVWPDYLDGHNRPVRRVLTSRLDLGGGLFRQGPDVYVMPWWLLADVYLSEAYAHAASLCNGRCRYCEIESQMPDGMARMITLTFHDDRLASETHSGDPALPEYAMMFADASDSIAF